MRKFILFLLIFQLYLCEETFNNWKLVFNEGDQITIIPGVFTKILIKLEQDQNNFWSENIEETIFKLSLKDKNFVFIEEKITLNSTESLVYSTYLGLKCINSIEGDEYTLKIKVSSTANDKSYDSTISLSININRVPTPINLSTVTKSMPEKSFNYFKLNNEIYNVDEIEFETKTDLDSNAIDLNELEISSFSDREILSEDNPANHAIIFDDEFGLRKKSQEFGKNNFAINIYFKNTNLSTCFSLPNSQFNLSIEKDIPENIDDKVKNSIKDCIKDQTYNYDITNSIKLNTFIPVAPVILTCEFKLNSLIDEEIETDKYNAIYKNFITEKGNIDIIVNNLKENEEYYASCEISNTNYGEKKEIEITIGNFDGADKSIQLIPSKDYNRQPQCARFYFEKKIDLSIITKGFQFKVINYCYYIMKKDESILTKGLPTILCQLTESSQDYITICVAPLPLYNLGKYFSLEDKETFNKAFSQFVSETQNNYNDNNLLIKIKNVQKIIDLDIRRSSINAVFKNKTDSNPLKLFFEISSTHRQPVECYYNTKLNEYLKFSLFKKPIILQPNKKTELEVEISSPSENKMYSLYFQCYNILPNFSYRYKTTGLMIMYTYLHSNINDASIEKEEKYEKYENTTLNCDLKKNMLNPRCLKDNTISIYKQLMTDIPQSIKSIEAQAQKFKKVIGHAKKQLLQNLQTVIVKDFAPTPSENNNETDYFISLFQKAIEFAKYLTFTDCSVYASGKSNKEEETIKARSYIDCRDKKKDYLETIIDILKRNLNDLNCSTIIDTIVNGIEQSPEESLKYILLLVNEISNNPDSFKEGLSEIFINTSICLQEGFDDFWGRIQNKINNTQKYLNTSISAIKKDAIFIIFRTLTNLAKVIHYDEIDGYINAKRTNTGLILNDQLIKIQNKIIDFSKKLNEFGDELYPLSGSMLSKVITRKDLNASTQQEMKIVEIQSKGIIIKLDWNYLLKKNNADYLQVLAFDSPLVSVKSVGEQKEASDSINYFISIILYNKNGQEIPISSIDENHRPEILYLKDKYESLKKCYYYNEVKQELESDGIIVDENFDYKGKKYFKCTSSHLTAFTAGTYNFNSQIPWWAVLSIISVIFIILIIAIIIFRIAKKRAKERFSEGNINSDFKNEEGLLEY